MGSERPLFIAVGQGSHGPYGAGVAVSRLLGDAGELCFAEISVRKDSADGGIGAREQILRCGTAV